MTHTTDKERAEFETRFNGQLDLARDLDAWGKVCYKNRLTQYAFAGWQASRRAQVVPKWLIDEVVPAIDPAGLDPEKHHCEYALYQDRERIRRALAAEPQPPENQTTFQTEVGAAPQPPEEDSLMSEIRTSKTVAAAFPKFNHAAKRKLELLQGNGATITGYAIEKDGRLGAIDCNGFVYWWNDAAPVQMPEPYDYVSWYQKGYDEQKRTALYTENQVRQLLAQHGIK